MSTSFELKPAARCIQAVFGLGLIYVVGMAAPASAAPALGSIAMAQVSESESPDVEAELSSFVKRWAAAWQAGEPAPYFAYYGQNFKPTDGRSRAEWRIWRRDRLAANKDISVGIGQIKVNLLKENVATVTFAQRYRSHRYEDQCIKSLRLNKLRAGWVIVAENILDPDPALALDELPVATVAPQSVAPATTANKPEVVVNPVPAAPVSKSEVVKKPVPVVKAEVAAASTEVPAVKTESVVPKSTATNLAKPAAPAAPKVEPAVAVAPAPAAVVATKSAPLADPRKTEVLAATPVVVPLSPEAPSRPKPEVVSSEKRASPVEALKAPLAVPVAKTLPTIEPKKAEITPVKPKPASAESKSIAPAVAVAAAAGGAVVGASSSVANAPTALADATPTPAAKRELTPEERERQIKDEARKKALENTFRPPDTTPPVVITDESCYGGKGWLASQPADPPTPEAARIRALKPKEGFRDCEDCPEMMVIPKGGFRMGAQNPEAPDEAPVRRVEIQSFAAGRFEVTWREFERFVIATKRQPAESCRAFNETSGIWDSWAGVDWSAPGYIQTPTHPVVCVGFDDAKAYVAWMSEKTGKRYRLLSEAEWEYAARGGSADTTPWGREERLSCRHANIADSSVKGEFAWPKNMGCSDGSWGVSRVGLFQANAYGLQDVIGNVWEWVEDCATKDYTKLVSNGRPYTCGDCQRRIIRGAGFSSAGEGARFGKRGRALGDRRSVTIGFRIARDLE